MNEDKKQEMDVEALVQEASKWNTDGQFVGALKYSAHGIIQRLAKALDAERTRADGWRRVGEDNDRHAFEACGHLVAVLQHGWPDGTTAPACVREARAFLAGKSTDGDQQRAHELLTAAGVHEDELSRRIEALALDREKAWAEAARLRADLGTANRFHATAIQERDAFKAALAAEDEAHTNALGELAALRAELAVEQGKTKAHLDAANAWRERCTSERAKLREIFDAFEFTLGDPSRPEHVAHVVAEAKRLRATFAKPRHSGINRNPFAEIIPTDALERGILEFVDNAIKSSARQNSENVFDLLVQATRAAEERKAEIERLKASDEKSFADLAVMAERSWKEQAPFASVKIAFEWGFVRGAQAILGAKGGA